MLKLLFCADLTCFPLFGMQKQSENVSISKDWVSKVKSNKRKELLSYMQLYISKSPYNGKHKASDCIPIK